MHFVLIYQDVKKCIHLQNNPRHENEDHILDSLLLDRIEGGGKIPFVQPTWNAQDASCLMKSYVMRKHIINILSSSYTRIIY